MDTLIEEIFLSNIPSTARYDHLQSIQSKILIFTRESTRFRAFDGNDTMITYCLVGTNDFGITIEKIQIWQQLSHLNYLTSIQIKDDIRLWNEVYRPSAIIPRYYYNHSFFIFN